MSRHPTKNRPVSVTDSAVTDKLETLAREQPGKQKTSVDDEMLPQRPWQALHAQSEHVQRIIARHERWNKTKEAHLRESVCTVHISSIVLGSNTFSPDAEATIDCSS